MIIYLPCRLGEEFTVRHFKDWVDGKRVYVNGPAKTLTGFSKGLFTPTIYAKNVFATSAYKGHTEFLEYDPEGEYGQNFFPKYKVSLDIGHEDKLCNMGFPGGRKAFLYGLKFEKGTVMAEFVTTDRHEHLYYAIKSKVYYAALDEEPKVTVVKYDNRPGDSRQMSLFDL